METNQRSSVQLPRGPQAPDTLGVGELPKTLTTSVELSQVETKGLLALVRILKATGAGWATEAQWRSFGTRDHPDYQVRAFRIPDLVAKGVVEMETCAFNAIRYGAEPAPMAIYRPKL